MLTIVSIVSIVSIVKCERMSKRGHSGRGGEGDGRAKKLAIEMGPVSEETMAILHLLPNEQVEEPASQEQKRYFAVLVRQMCKQDEYPMSVRNELYASKSKMTEALSELKSSMAGTRYMVGNVLISMSRGRNMYTSGSI